MHLDHLKFGLRTLAGQASYALIAILSLALGTASFVILGIYSLYELGYDRHHRDADQIYRVVQTQQRAEPYFMNRVPATGITFAPLMARTNNAYQDYTRIQPAPLNPYLLSSDDNAIYWEDVFIADENIFDFFTHEVLSGDPNTALKEPNTIAINESMAFAFFGSDSPIGRQLITNMGTALRVTLVFRDLPANSHLKYSALISRLSLNALDIDSLNTLALTLNTTTPLAGTYFKMQENYSPVSFEDSVRAMTETYLPDIANQQRFASVYDWYLEPLPAIHLKSLTDGSDAQKNRYMVLTYLVIGGFILLVANLNYTNLAISRYSKRTKELGIRKLLGASRGQLITVFFTESSLILVSALCLAAVLVPVVQSLLPPGSFLDGTVALKRLLDIKTVTIVGTTVIAVGMLATLYPAVYLTGLKLIDTINGQPGTARSSARTKETILFVQLAVATAGIISAILMMSQMHYVQRIPLGFELENRLAVQIRGKENVERIPLLANELRTHSSIKSTAITDKLPFTLTSIATGYVETNAGERQTVPYHRVFGASDYVETFGLEILQGRSLDALASIDSTNAVIVNEAFVDAMNWDNPIGKILFTPGAYGLSEVVGVARNFNYFGFDRDEEPIAINTLDQQAVIMRERNVSLPTYSRYLIIAIEEGHTEDALQLIQDEYRNFDPSSPILYEFLDRRFDELNSKQLNQGILMTVFSFLAVVIACSGLVAMLAFKLANRTKEMSIRKVLGASRFDLVLLQLKTVLANVLPAMITGCILASFIFRYWQQQFANDYRISLDYLAFLVATCLVAGLAVLTTAIQTSNATRVNPIQNLRCE